MASSNRTLRATLTLWLECACGLALLVLCVGLGLVRRAEYRLEADDALASEASAQVARLLAQDDARSPDEWLSGSLATSVDGCCALRAEDGRILATWNMEHAERLPPVASSTAAGPLQAAFVSLGPRLRMVTLPFRQREQLYFLQLARPEGSWLRSLAGEWPLLLLCAVTLGLAARFAARRIVRRVLRPLGGLAETARALSPINLRERFRVQSGDAELRSLEQELNEALRRMEAGYQAQAQFASNVAHELKTPMAALVIDAQVSRRESRDPEKSRAFMSRAEQELKHLAELVESLLVMARVDTREARAELVYVDDVLRRAVSHCRSQADEHGVVLRLDVSRSTDACDPFVRGDAQLLQALVENLVRNAIRHSPSGTEVLVEASTRAKLVEIAVHDQGPGIPEEFRQAVFERGVRAASRAGGSNGVGLGLALVRSIAELHHGKVSMEQNASGGCSFVVTLPAALGATDATAYECHALPGS